MSDETKPPDRLTQAIFSVCVDEAVVSSATAASVNVPGAQFAGEFRDYITADKRPHFSATLKNAASCVALIDFDRDPEMALETAERLRQIFLKKINIVGIGSRMDAGILLRAVRNGCSEFLTKPVNAEELAAALRRFASGVAADHRAQGSVGRVIAFSGAKGGVGTTTLAVHLATHLAGQHGKKTLLIDLRQQLGHVALYLGLKETQYHFDELLRNANSLDPELLNGLVVRHTSGLDVIASPEVSSGPEEFSDERLGPVMDFLRREYDYILLDSAMALHSSKSPIVDQSDEIYIVSTPDIAALRDLGRLVERLSLNESSAGKLHIVVNRSTSIDAVSSEQIERAVRFPIAVSIPNNYFELMRAINDGEPIPPQRRSDFSQTLGRWADRIVRGPDDAKPAALKHRLFSFLR